MPPSSCAVTIATGPRQRKFRRRFVQSAGLVIDRGGGFEPPPALSLHSTRKEAAMNRPFVLLMPLAGLWLTLAGPSQAADLSGQSMRSAKIAAPRGVVLPFPRSERSQAVWDSNACWSGCQSYCTWGEAACLQRDPQGHCLKVTNHCDRVCQRECRTEGGPFVPDIFDF